MLIRGGGLEARGQELVRVYSSEGPAPALYEAASAFSANDTVKVVGGPPSEWMEGATADADVVCSSADFMMSEFIRNAALQIDASTLTPLYTRPSAILVRPGNPKRIDDFPDLLRGGLRVMVVTGSGQTGLWEDMAGRTADVQVVRRLRENISAYAPNSTEAVKLWRERKDIDAWITWDIWHMPLRTEAKLVPVSKEYRIFRHCSVALTKRGRDKPLAAEFVKFLASPQGARVFASWGWMTPQTNGSPVAISHDITVVCAVDQNISGSGAESGLTRVKQLIEDYESMGIARNELHISAVLWGNATSAVLKDGPYRKLKGAAAVNPHKSLIEQLVACGVSLEVSSVELKARGWSKADLLPGVTIVPGAQQRIVDLQLRGYAYIKL